MLNNNLSSIDALSFVSFVIGLQNYIENVDQNTLQEALQKSTNDIHKHLQIQDEKINYIIQQLGGDVNV